MKTKTNKEIIEELKKIKIDHTDSDNDGFNRLCSTEISKIMNLFTQALNQKEREVREEIVEEIKKVKKLPYYAILSQSRNGIDYCFACGQAWEECSCSARNTGYKQAIDDILSNLKSNKSEGK